MFLLDVRPDPVSAGPTVGLVLLAIVVLVLSAALIISFVFLLKWLNGRKANASPIASSGGAQPSNPNQ